ncbi:hypothetical protein PR048_019841 [Dryococelus australis]|uniref:Uncharacterized protein n=1 Tax=Dryococelus australis TaxID=614101 RepID=A0ABQ9H4R5_9NEOP|nr:hypothetical protein PR048_019841 [Dryococelus australis]
MTSLALGGEEGKPPYGRDYANRTDDTRVSGILDDLGDIAQFFCPSPSTARLEMRRIFWASIEWPLVRARTTTRDDKRRRSDCENSTWNYGALPCWKRHPSALLATLSRASECAKRFRRLLTASWGEREIPQKTRRPTASSGTIPTSENPVTRPGIEPGSERVNRSATVAPRCLGVWCWLLRFLLVPLAMQAGRRYKEMFFHHFTLQGVCGKYPGLATDPVAFRKPSRIACRLYSKRGHHLLEGVPDIGAKAPCTLDDRVIQSVSMLSYSGRQLSRRVSARGSIVAGSLEKGEKSVGMRKGDTTLETRILASHLDEPGSILGGVAPVFSHVGIVLDDAGRRTFSGISRFPRSFTPALLHTHLASPSSALKTSMLRAAQIISLTHSLHVLPVYCISIFLSALYQNPVTKGGAIRGLGKESAMAFVRDPSNHSPGVISENHGKPKSRWPARESNPGPPERESSLKYRMKRGDYGAVPKCKGRENGRSPRKPANQRHRPARLPHATPLGIEASLPWEASSLTTTPPRLRLDAREVLDYM